jgi:hypothetical protein
MMEVSVVRSPGPWSVVRSPVSAGYFDALWVQPMMGRTFLPEEDRPGARAVLVMSYELWQRRFVASLLFKSKRTRSVDARRARVAARNSCVDCVLLAGPARCESRSDDCASARMKMEDRRWRIEDGGWKMEDGRWKMEDGGWKIEDGRLKMEDRSSILDPPFSIFQPRSSILDLPSSILNPRSSILDLPSSILLSQPSAYEREEPCENSWHCS